MCIRDRNRSSKSGIGFVADVNSKSESKSYSNVIKSVEPEDLIKFGLIPEFIGRLPIIATLEELDDSALKRILIEPKNALSKQYKKLLDMEGDQLEIRDDAIQAVATCAMTRKTGARGLRTILEGALLDVMYDLPSIQGAEKVVVDEAVVLGESTPYIIYANEDPALPVKKSS